jgi:hypothetical protein
VLAITATMIGVAVDAGSGNKELTNTFAATYVLGCLVAVLAVRKSGVFTAVVQPPLILFCAVPGAYWLFHGATFTDIKGILINCGYPLVERFPLMLLTSAGVLLIGMSRWYFQPASSPRPDAGAEATAEKLGTKFLAGLNRRLAHATGAPPSRRKRGADRPDRTTGRSRERPRRQRPTSGRREEPPVRRRPRPPADSTRRGQPARKARHSQPTKEPRRDRRQRTGRPTRDRADRYRPAEPPEPPQRRQPPTRPTNGSNETHHPISQVRYRSQDSGELFSTRRARAESWEYDI